MRLGKSQKSGNTFKVKAGYLWKKERGLKMSETRVRAEHESYIHIYCIWQTS